MMKKIVLFIFLQFITFSTFALDGITVNRDNLSDDGKLIYDILTQIDHDFPGTIQINSADRTIDKQAELMQQLPPETLKSFYKGGAYVKDIERVNNSSLSDTDKVKAVAKIIRDARAGGSFVSRHIGGEAIDIQRPTKQSDVENLKTELAKRGLAIKDEKDQGINCLHLSFGGVKNDAYLKRKELAEKNRDDWNKWHSLIPPKTDSEDSPQQKLSKEGGVSMKMEATDKSFTEADDSSTEDIGKPVFQDQNSSPDSTILPQEEDEDNE